MAKPNRSTIKPAALSPKTHRRSYPDAWSELPFVDEGGRSSPGSNWRVPPIDDYGKACDIGSEYAAHFIQYLRDNPGMVGSNALGAIARDINFGDETRASGYWVGFFGELERFIYAAAEKVDPFKDLDQLTAYYAAAWACRKAAQS